MVNPIGRMFGKKLFGRDSAGSQKLNTCVTCGGPATEFKDDLSRREYRISSMCQKCQDSVFEGDEE